MHLLVALVLDQIGDLGPAALPGLATALVEPEREALRPLCEPYRNLAIKIRDAPNVKKGAWSADWRRQCLLFLVGAGLVHLGRKLHVDDGQRAKEWCFHLAALAARQFLAESPEKPPDAPARHHETGGDKPRHAGRLVGRVDEYRRVRTLLTDGRPGVAVLSGRHGVGKTSLLEEVIADLEGARSRAPIPRIRHHEANPGSRLDAGTLIEYVAGRSEPSGSPLVGLESALKRLGGAQVIIVVDDAENLMAPGARTLADPHLDQALEMLATDTDHHVKVLLVSKCGLDSPGDGTWPESSHMVLPQLDPEPYFDFLATLGRDARWDVAALPEHTRRKLYVRMQGNPRLGELARAVVLLDDTSPDLRGLADRLYSERSKDVPTYLIRRLTQGTGQLQRVLAALAVFDAPVPVELVAKFLRETAELVRQALDELVTARVVHRADSELYLLRPHESEVMRAELPPEATRAEDFVRAAGQLTAFGTNAPGEVPELGARLAGLRALLRAGEYQEVRTKIDRIDVVLREWNCRHLLLEQRKELVGHLGDDFEELRNYNSLGQIYVDLGSFPEASEAYGHALRIARQIREPIATLKVQGNIAVMYWMANDTARARQLRIRA